MVKICNNTKVRVPTVNICVLTDGTPNISPLKPGSAKWTSDGYCIDYSPYILTFTLPAEAGYFTSSSITFTPTSPGAPDPTKIFILCNIITNASDSGLDNYVMYLVLNGVSANGQASKATYKYTSSYMPWAGEDPEVELKPFGGAGGSIDNEGQF